MKWQPHIAGWCILGGLAYSLGDEFHQSFVSNRGASLSDCAIDTAGAILAMILIYGITRGLRKGTRNTPNLIRNPWRGSSSL